MRGEDGLDAKGDGAKETAAEGASSGAGDTDDEAKADEAEAEEEKEEEGGMLEENEEATKSG